MGTKCRPQGVTLHELAVVLAVAATVATIAITGTESMVQRAALRSTAAELVSDLQHVRSMSVARNQTLRIAFRAFDTGGSCYVLYSGAMGACECTAAGQAICLDSGEVLRAVFLPAEGRTRIQANVITITYDPRLGTATPAGRVDIIGRDGRSLRHVVSLMGRVRTCSPGGRVNGVPACAPS